MDGDKENYPSPRFQHTMVLHDGKIYLFGGKFKETRLNDLWVLDCELMNWKRVRTYGKVPSPRYGHLMTAIGSNIFITTGYCPTPDSKVEFSNLSHRFDLDTFEWHAEYNTLDFVPPEPEGRIGTAGIIYCKNRMLMFGGIVKRETTEKSQHLTRVNDAWIVEFKSNDLKNEKVMTFGSYNVTKLVTSETFADIYSSTHEIELEDYYLRRIKIKEVDGEKPVLEHLEKFAAVYHHYWNKINECFIDVRNGDKSVIVSSQYCSEGTLPMFFKAKKEILGEPDRLVMIQEAIICLKYLHSLGLIHRGLSPNSVYVNKETKFNDKRQMDETSFVIKIGNPGLEMNNSGNNSRNLSILSVKIYDPPEGQTEITEKFDIWQIGLLIHYIMTGEDAPINPHTFQMNAKAQLDKTFANLRKNKFRNETMIEKLISSCLKMNPTDRSTCVELLEMIRSLSTKVDTTFKTKSFTLSSHIDSKSISGGSDDFDDEILGGVSGSSIHLQSLGKTMSERFSQLKKK